MPSFLCVWLTILMLAGATIAVQTRADKLGAGYIVLNTSDCPNFRDGYWIAANGPASKKDARFHASKARK